MRARYDGTGMGTAKLAGLASLIALGGAAAAHANGGGFNGPSLATVAIPLEVERGIEQRQITAAVNTCLAQGDAKAGLTSLLQRLYVQIYRKAPRQVEMRAVPDHNLGNTQETLPHYYDPEGADQPAWGGSNASFDWRSSFLYGKKSELGPHAVLVDPLAYQDWTFTAAVKGRPEHSDGTPVSPTANPKSLVQLTSTQPSSLTNSFGAWPDQAGFPWGAVDDQAPPVNPNWGADPSFDMQRTAVPPSRLLQDAPKSVSLTFDVAPCSNPETWLETGYGCKEDPVTLEAPTFLPFFRYRSVDVETSYDEWGRSRAGRRLIQGLTLIVPADYERPVSFANPTTKQKLPLTLDLRDYVDCLRGQLGKATTPTPAVN